MSFYASTDATITASDYLIGSISVSFASIGSTSVALHCMFPTTIPAGTYYIGWIIDRDDNVDETDESNNTACKPSPMLTVTGQSSILYVDAHARGANDGSDWADAFQSLQDALAGALKGSEIRVAAGIYTPDRGAAIKRGDRAATFALPSGVVLRGGYAGAGAPDPDTRNTETYETVLSGDLNGDDLPVADPCDPWTRASRAENSRHVVTAVEADSTTVLDGFRVVGGWADGPADTVAPSRDSQGAGMYIAGGGPRVRGCLFLGNHASGSGGALYAIDSEPELAGCTFSQNAAGDVMAGGGGAGGALYAERCDTRLSRCSFLGNAAGSDGGAIWNGRGGLILVSCTLNGNRAGNGGAVSNGWGASLSAANCCFHANQADGRAGAMDTFYGSTATLVNCTIGGNRQVDFPGAVACGPFDAQGANELLLLNCILWNGGDEIWDRGGSAITVTSSDIQGGWFGAGNLDANPSFVNPAGADGVLGTADDDLRLGWGSPCIDAGDAALLPEDVMDLDGDGDIKEPLPLDRDGNPRQTGSAVDMGAYEGIPAKGVLPGG